MAESYDRLAGRSQEIIQTLQNERDAKIVECEELRTQVYMHGVTWCVYVCVGPCLCLHGVSQVTL